MNPRFPETPRDPFWSSDANEARATLERIAAWRESFVAWLRGPARADLISPDLATLLLELCGAEPGDRHERYRYRLGRFPAVDDADDVDPADTMRQVLLWRAGVVDFLDDVWDVMGEPEFAFEECQHVVALLLPADARRCRLCLGSVEDPRTHFEHCAVQHEWRA